MLVLPGPRRAGPRERGQRLDQGRPSRDGQRRGRHVIQAGAPRRGPRDGLAVRRRELQTRLRAAPRCGQRLKHSADSSRPADAQHNAPPDQRRTIQAMRRPRRSRPSNVALKPAVRPTPGVRAQRNQRIQRVHQLVLARREPRLRIARPQEPKERQPRRRLSQLIGRVRHSDAERNKVQVRLRVTIRNPTRLHESPNPLGPMSIRTNPGKGM